MPPFEKTKFPEHSRGFPRFSKNQGNNYKPDKLPLNQPSPFKDADRAIWKGERSSLCHPIRNGFNDPVTIALVVDVLMRLEHDTMFTTHDLVTYLDRESPQIIWDTVTVGRIMADLAAAAKECGAPANALPLDETRYVGKRHFVVHVSLPNWVWWGVVRANLSALAKQTIRAERESKRNALRGTFPWEAVTAPWGLEQPKAKKVA